MLKTFFWYFRSWAYIVLTLPVLLRVIYLDRRGRTEEMDALTDRYTMKAARRLFKFTGSTVRVIGLENVPAGFPVLFVSNHQSHVDNIVIHGFINARKGFVSIVEVLSIPILSTMMKYMKCVFIDRSDIRQTLGCMETAVETLKAGRSMVIFPEGRINEDGVLSEFKKGCLKLAVRAGVPIVPVTLKNTARVMNKDGSRIFAADVECIISPPVDASVSGRADEAKLIERVRKIIGDNL
jgi:1-acyl-sn-glycerol-3-phosphate acyltransferase